MLYHHKEKKQIIPGCWSSLSEITLWKSTGHKTSWCFGSKTVTCIKFISIPTYSKEPCPSANVTQHITTRRNLNLWIHLTEVLAYIKTTEETAAVKASLLALSAAFMFCTFFQGYEWTVILSARSSCSKNTHFFFNLFNKRKSRTVNIFTPSFPHKTAVEILSACGGKYIRGCGWE